MKALKTRQLVTTFVLLATLIAASIPATAEEPAREVLSRVGSTTIGGFVDSSIGGGTQPTHRQSRGWWLHVLYRLGFQRRG